jgi:hypothetical protein
MDEPIYQRRMLEYIKQYPNTGSVMIPIHGRTRAYGTDAYFQCRLFPAGRAAEEMEIDDTNHWSGTTPGFTRYGFGSDADTIYTRFNNEYDMEPFVIERSFDGLGKRDEIEIVEEFRLLNNLYFDRTKNEYVDLADDTTVVKIEGDFVTVHRKYLKRYLAVKEMIMLIHIDSQYPLGVVDPDIKTGGYTEKTEDKIYSFYIGVARGTKQQTFSMIYAKTAIRGCAIADCGYWPYDEDNRNYEDYIIGIDEDGDEIVFTSEPSKLANYYGKNPNAPHYLTPVFFRREVLQKYYNNPDRYTVEAGIIRCGTRWLLYIDNESPDYVSAYLGDLGRDLPDSNEQKHWKTYNIAIDGKLSKSKYGRDFLSIPTSSDSPIFIFQHKYEEINKTFKAKAGWPLFLPLHDDDKYTLSGLRIPLLNSQPEFDQQVLALVKVMLDSLNEKQIESKLPPSEEKIVGSISKLKKLFEVQGLSDYADIVKFLRNVQELRSTSAAHKKGRSYDRIAKVFSIGEVSYADAFIGIMNQANAFLEYIELNIDELTATK